MSYSSFQTVFTRSLHSSCEIRKVVPIGTNSRRSYLNPRMVPSWDVSDRDLVLDLSKMPSGFWLNTSSRPHGGVRRSTYTFAFTGPSGRGGRCQPSARQGAYCKMILGAKGTYRRWVPEEDKQLREMVEGGKSVRMIALRLKRTEMAVRGRLSVLKISLKQGGSRINPQREHQT
jgi:hypothetical protein